MLVYLVALAMAGTTPAEAVTVPAASTADPNEKICESIVPLGSRLAKKRSAQLARSGRKDGDSIERLSNRHRS